VGEDLWRRSEVEHRRVGAGQERSQRGSRTGSRSVEFRYCHLKLIPDTSSILADIASPYILIVTGSHASAAKREELPLQSSSQLVKPSNPVNDNTTVQGPLLDRVQILTTPLITGLLVVFLLLLPILYVGISALVGIQVPPRMLEIGKSMQVGKDRKDQ